jgi:hypothetical protein
MNTRTTNLGVSVISLLLAVLGCSETAKESAWQKAQVVADNLDHPSAITVDGEFIYYVTGGTIASLNEGTSGLWEMPITGGAPTQLFKGVKENERSVTLPDTWVLLTDDKYVYWASGYIWRTPKNGGESEKITIGTPTEMVMDEQNIYWQNYVGEGMPPVPILSAPKTGGDPKPITAPLIRSGLAIDKDFIYWTQNEGIFRMPKTGGEPTKVYSPPDGQVTRGLATDAESFYFAQGSGKHALIKLPKTGGSPVQLAPTINTTHRIVVDDTHVYFVTDYQTFSSAISRAVKSGGEVTQMDTGHVRSFMVSGRKVFISDVSKIYALDK